MTGRILVTGAGGVIATGVVHRLLAAGHDVVAVDLRPDSLAPLAAAGATTHQLDLVSGDVDRIVSRGDVDVVVHAAAIVDNNLMQEQPMLGFSVNATAAVSLLDAAARGGIRRFVFLSSRAVYGLATGGLASDPPVAEEETLDPRGVYDVCKVAVEGMGRNIAAQHGMEFVALRFATIFGPGKTARHSNASLFSRIVEESLAGRPVHVAGSEDEAYDLVYVDDVRDAVTSAVLSTGPLRAAYNLGSGRVTTLGEIVDSVRRHVPGARITLAGEGQALPLRYRYPLDVSAARTDLGYEPQPSIDGAVTAYLDELSRLRSHST